MPDYQLTYDTSWCYDDGGVGHDRCWSTATHNFSAKDDKSARATAKRLITGRNSSARRCSCGDRSSSIMRSLDRVVSEVREPVELS